jgi:hypothetical protein
MILLDPEFHLHVAGVLLIGLALFHIALPKQFGWREEMRPVSLLTRQIFYVHTFFIALTVGLMGLLALFYADELLQPSALARGVLSGLLAFWLCRLGFQIFVYDAALWRGKKFETYMHWLFTTLWLYLVVVFGWVLWRQLV